MKLIKSILGGILSRVILIIVAFFIAVAGFISPEAMVERLEKGNK